MPFVSYTSTESVVGGVIAIASARWRLALFTLYLGYGTCVELIVGWECITALTATKVTASHGVCDTLRLWPNEAA